MGSAHSGRIVNSRILKSGIVAKLRRASLCQLFHPRLRPKMPAARRTGLDAGWFEADRHTVVAQRALKDFAGGRIEFRNIERAASHAIPATYAVSLLEIDNAVGILDNRGTRRAGAEAAWAGP